MMQPHMLTSSSAKADDPVFRDADWLLRRRRLLDTRFRGYDGRV
jgi:hypothetical protein